MMASGPSSDGSIGSVDRCWLQPCPMRLLRRLGSAGVDTFETRMYNPISLLPWQEGCRGGSL